MQRNPNRSDEVNNLHEVHLEVLKIAQRIASRHRRNMHVSHRYGATDEDVLEELKEDLSRTHIDLLELKELWNGTFTDTV